MPDMTARELLALMEASDHVPWAESIIMISIGPQSQINAKPAGLIFFCDDNGTTIARMMLHSRQSVEKLIIDLQEVAETCFPDG